MVVKRQCSFCAGEIEPGTGMMFVKRDGTVFHFCSSSCRKQQLHLGRVGHRLKWTRAHTLKRAQSAAGPAAARAATAKAEPVQPVVTPAKPIAKGRTKKPEAKKPAAQEPEAEKAGKAAGVKPSAPPVSAEPNAAPPARRPRAKKPKSTPATSERSA